MEPENFRRWENHYKTISQVFYYLAFLAPTLVVSLSIDKNFKFDGRVFPLLMASGMAAMPFLMAARFFKLKSEQAVLLPSLKEVLATDHRLPVLYLRAFKGEQQFPFARVPKVDLDSYVGIRKFHELPSSNPYASSYILLSFERFLSRTITERIGPMVALGSPEDKVPPEGAARTYVDEDHWKEEFIKLAERAVCIVMMEEVDVAQNLQWEFRHILERRMQQKLFVFGMPVGVSPLSPTERKIRIWWRKQLRLDRWWIDRKNRRWQGVLKILNEAGYNINAGRCVRNGSVITFNEDGNEIVLTEGARMPEEFIDPVVKRLNLGKQRKKDKRDWESNQGRKQRPTT